MKGGFMLRLLLLLVSCASAQFCELVGYEIYAQDSGANVRGTFLGVISTSTINQYSIMNTLGDYGSEFSNTSIFNKFSKFGDQFSNTSAYNSLASLPPMIVEYRAPTNTYYKVGYLTINNILTPRYNPNILIPVLAFGNCNGCTPKVFYDTVTVTKRDTVIKNDTLRIHDTTKVVVRDTVIKIDSVKYCPAALVRATPGRPGSGSKVFDISGRFWASCKE